MHRKPLLAAGCDFGLLTAKTLPYFCEISKRNLLVVAFLQLMTFALLLIVGGAELVSDTYRRPVIDICCSGFNQADYTLCKMDILA